MKPYVVFWDLLPLALIAAETRTKANKAIDAIKRLRLIEGQPEAGGSGSGQTGYLAYNDPYQAVNDYIAHIYDSKPAPFWLTSAEKG